MTYNINPKNNDKISTLSFGCMRLPKDASVCDKIIAEAIDLGINYFDTAYIYPGNEEKTGRALANCKGREKVKIATKMPPYMVSKYADFDKIFNKQLSRLKTDYIDYYMLHMLPAVSTWQRLIDIGFLSWLSEKRQKKEILNFGFSYHGGNPEFVRLIDAYDWDFTMIQYNYYDEHNQAGVSGLLYAYNKGIPVIAMEPLRGGTLVNLPKNAARIIADYPIKHTAAQWGLKWCFNQKEIFTVLSGIASIEQLHENAQIAIDTRPGSLIAEETAVYSKITAAINTGMYIGCTGCNYCMPCPAGVDIPLCFSCLNDIKIKGRIQGEIHYILRTDKHNASMCTACGKCEKHCPQGIKIIDGLRLTSGKLENIAYKPLRSVIRRFMRYG